MNAFTLPSIVAILIFPCGIFLLITGLVYEWSNRKLLAQLQNRVGPRWFQPFADVLKLLAKEEIVPERVNATLFIGLPIVALAGALTAALSVPIAGLQPVYSFPGDLIVALYLLSLLSLCIGLAGSNTMDRFSVVGATRTLTQLISYEAPFLLAMLGPAVVARSWQVSSIASFSSERWLILTQPLGFIVAVIGLMGKLEMPPFDAPEAETEVVAGALTEYSGRGFALFRLSKGIEMVIGLTLIATFYLGGITDFFGFLFKTLALLLFIVVLQALFTRLRIDQTVGLWWRYGVLLVLLQWLIVIVGQRLIS